MISQRYRWNATILSSIIMRYIYIFRRFLHTSTDSPKLDSQLFSNIFLRVRLKFSFKFQSTIIRWFIDNMCHMFRVVVGIYIDLLSPQRQISRSLLHDIVLMSFPKIVFFLLHSHIRTRLLLKFQSNSKLILIPPWLEVGKHFFYKHLELECWNKADSGSRLLTPFLCQ